jgi:PTS system mannose-specific IIA component
MIGLVLVTHGRLAVEFRAALEHVVGPQNQIEAVTIGPDDDVETRRKDIIEAVKRVDSGDGVAILTDMFGGTPSNLAISVMSRPKVEVLAGINLPMLVKLAKVRDECPLADAVAAAQDAGRKYVTIASRVLSLSSAIGRGCTRVPRPSLCKPSKNSRPTYASRAALKPWAAHRSWV